MDVFERLNRTFGAWYEGLFGGNAAANGDDGDLRPRDILRRLLRAMEDQRREGLDGQVYVPNVYVLDIAVDGDDERQYVRAFLDADELAMAVRRYLDQHAYRTRGGLKFEINEVAAGAQAGKVQVRCRFDTAVAPESADEPVAVEADAPAAVSAVRDADDEDGSEPGTVPAVALASLALRGPDGRGEVFPLTTRGAQIGRSRQSGNDIVLNADNQVSKRHARVEHLPGVGFRVYDLGSTNGTFHNEMPADGGQPLRDGDTIRVGQTQIVFRGPSPAKPAPTPPIAAAPGTRLVTDSGETFALASEMLVGRALTSDLILLGEGVAARHARLFHKQNLLYVEDFGTPGGTVVNGERIPPHFPVVLYDNDHVAFGAAGARVTLSR